MRYSSGSAFRQALEERLRNQHRESGVPLDRLRKMIAFERIIARLTYTHPNLWVLKGGLALQLRLGDRARTTKDIDLMHLTHSKELHRVEIVRQRLDVPGILDQVSSFRANGRTHYLTINP